MGAIPNKLAGFQDIERDEAARSQVRGRLGRADPRPLRLAPDADVRGHGARRAAHALRDGREPGAVRGRHQPHAAAARRPRLPGRPGHPVHQDLRVRRRRAALERLVGRGGGHGHELRAPRPARAQGARPAGRGPRRHVDPERAGAPAGPRLGPPDGRGDLGRVPLALADAHRHELRPPGALGGIQWPCPDEEHDGLAVPAQPAVGRAGRRPAGAVLGRRALPAGRCARRRLPAAAHDRAPAGVLQHRRAVQPLPLAAAQGRGAVPVARGRRGAPRGGGRDRQGVEPARIGRGAGADRDLAAARGWRS